jgi:23S rRNA (cytidine2498-2'-O)-methyltransferase
MDPTLILTADPDFAAPAQRELAAATTACQIGPPLAPGVWPATVEPDFFTLAERWRRDPPIFARHICPVQVTVPLRGHPSDEGRLRGGTADLLDLLDPALPFSVQTRTLGKTPHKPFPINQALAEMIEIQVGAPLNVTDPVQVLSVVVGEQTGYLGVSAAAHNLSDWAGGARRFAREPGQISRAEFKLLEALEVFSVDLPRYGVALDLGAAPGGWTRVLQGRGQYVTAVDPAALHPSLQAIKEVRHKQMTAEAYLAAGPDQYDLIVNDMRQDARDSARLMVAYAPYLYRHGEAIMTFKLPGEGRETVIDHAMNILRERYTIGGARHLFHNRSEITVYLQLD